MAHVRLPATVSQHWNRFCRRSTADRDVLALSTMLLTSPYLLLALPPPTCCHLKFPLIVCKGTSIFPWCIKWSYAEFFLLRVRGVYCFWHELGAWLREIRHQFQQIHTGMLDQVWDEMLTEMIPTSKISLIKRFSIVERSHTLAACIQTISK